MIARELVVVPPIAEEVREGLLSVPKTLPAKLFYDERGSVLFEEITELPEYYLTRTELRILCERAGEISAAAGQVTVVELGAGTAAKSCTLLRPMAKRQLQVHYFPVDISPAALDEAVTRVESECPGTIVRPLVQDFSAGFSFLRKIPGRKLVIYLGSSIGNFEPAAAVEMLTQVRRELSSGDSLLLGTDLAKSPAILIPAYDDAQGVTAAFNKNMLIRLNRELDADFDPENFRHIARWNPRESRMEMHLESLCVQSATIGALRMQVDFDPLERIHTESSYKYTMESVYSLLDQAGYTKPETWTDGQGWFALHLARV